MTVLGQGEMPDGSERPAALTGDRDDFNPGNRVAVAGVLRVIRRPAAAVNGVDVPAWWQVTVTGAAVVR